MAILGINAYHGDVAAAILADGRLVAAVEEERFTRVKHTAGVPHEAIASCLRDWGGPTSDVDHVAVSRNPKAHLLRKAAYAVSRRPSLSLLRGRAQNSAAVAGLPDEIGRMWADLTSTNTRWHWVEHHLAHVASAFYCSPHERAAVCAIDGFGDFVSTSWGTADGTGLDLSKRVFFPHSLGLLYLALTQYLGFPNFGDEYKVMGLAPYGQPDYVNQLRRLLHLKGDGTFRLDLAFFRHHSEGVRMEWRSGPPTLGPVFTDKLEELLGPARRTDEPVTARHEAIAASLQVVFEESALSVLRAVARDTGLRKLCFAGGCAMNSVLNGKIREHTPFEEVFIQPAAGDNGTALGAALYVVGIDSENGHLGFPRTDGTSIARSLPPPAA